MSIFSKLKSDDLEESQDHLGGYSPLETDIYNAKIKALYAGQSAGGAVSLNLVADINGQEYRETFWVTNRKGENFFLNRNDKTKKVPLPGFTVADDICLIATGKPLSEQKTEEKVVKVYDFDAGKEVPKSVPMVMDALDKEVSLGVIHQLVNKNVKQGDEYVPVADFRSENVVDKVFHPTLHLTVAEARNEQTEPKFYDAWLKRNQGNTRDRRKIKDGDGATAPKSSGAAASPRKSLFNK